MFNAALERLAAFRELLQMFPEPWLGGGQTQGPFGIAGSDQAASERHGCCRSRVRIAQYEPLAVAGSMAPQVFGIHHEESRMRALGFLQFAAFRQLLVCVLAKRLQEQESGLACALRSGATIHDPRAS